MALHKIINGIQIELTPEEEAATLAEWAANDQQALTKRQQREQERNTRQQALNKIALLAGLTQEERQLLFG